MAKEVAIQKRAQIDKATRHMLFAVCGAAIILGCAAVLSVYFVKWMIFNGKVIGEKTAVIKDYKTTQENVKKLAANVSALSADEDLEVIARERKTGCIDVDGNTVDMSEDIELARVCSALRVIPDALPSTNNDVAVYASLNKLFLVTYDESGNPVEPEAIAPGGTNVSPPNLVKGLGVVPVNLSIKNTSSTTKSVLDTVERSIRNFDIQAATIAWRSNEETGIDEIELQGSVAAYYSTSVKATLKTKTVYADEKKAKTKKTGSN